MNSKDYYNLLKIDRSATEDDIKKAYRKLALEFHPDVNTNKDAEGIFKALSEAYSVLSDNQKRYIYDQTGTTRFAGFSNTANRPFQRGRGVGGCMGRGMGKCSGLSAVFRRRPRNTRKTTIPGFISE
ncbi:MAG: DnaJ domain-containing protein [Desulfobacteraceae bacterium]|nr:DnaJ domain-containing protein [Desulfobacteraceae bacterium]